MNDTPNSFNPNVPNNPLGPDPRRRLKKVKRPIKRISPQGINPPMPPRPMQNSDFAQSAPENNAPVIDNDDFWDETNLPSVVDENYPEEQYTQTAPSQPHFISDEEILAEQPVKPSWFDVPETAKKATIIAAVVAFVIGIAFTKLFFGEQKIVRDGLQGVVVNSEVPRGRARCGVAEKTQGCVLYIMNPQRQELSASDFYDLASQLTGRQRFIIETGNMRYSNRKIKPGEIAQFNIPPLQ